MLLLFVGAAQGKDIETVAIGIGSDENVALADALAKAVAQVNGVRSSLEISTGKIEAIGNVTATDAKGGTTSEQTKAQVGTTPDARMRAQGSVSRYEVLSSEELADGRVKLSVRAFVARHIAPTYQAPGSSANRQRIAVFPVAAHQPFYDFFDQADGDELATAMADQLESSIMNTGKVSLLDRRTLATSLVELGLVGSSLTSASEKAKLRQFRGSDLIVIATIQEARYEVRSWQVKSTGQRKSEVDMKLEVDVRAVVPATGELLLTKRLSIHDAGSRSDAFRQVGDMAAFEVVRALTGSAPELPSHRPITRAEEAEAEPQGPRRSGVRLPGDR